MFQKVIKRVFDYIFGILMLICSSPFLLICAAIIKINSPESPILFKQERVGFKGKIINVYKLRSMTNECDEDGNLLPDEVRLKTWGKIIRKTNLDEIPQVFNLLKGEISLIGPRPLKKNEMVVMTEAEQALRQSVLPGISGWEAVNEGKTSTRREMAEYDLYYVNNWSLWLDIKIFFLTIYVIFCNARPEDEYRAPKIDDEPELNIEKETVTK